MAEGLNVYVLDRLGNNYLGLTKEQIYSVITHMIETGEVPEDIDAGFITKIQEMNKKGNLEFWFGSMAEFQALEKRNDNTLYLFTDDPTEDDFNAVITQLEQEIASISEYANEQIAEINQRLDDLSYEETTVVLKDKDDNQVTGTLTKEGKRVILNIIANPDVPETTTLLSFMYGMIPSNFMPKEDIDAFGSVRHYKELEPSRDFPAILTVFAENRSTSQAGEVVDYNIRITWSLATIGLPTLEINIKNIGWETN